MTEFQFLLNDRIAKIQSMNEMYDLENKAYLSFSGGKDSTVLSALFDIALPKNKIPRVYLNTGIEYKYLVDFVTEKAKTDERIKIVKPKTNIKAMLEKNGYPFKSKEHSQKLALFQKSGNTKTVINYLGNGEKKTFLCPEKLKYQFSDDFKIKVSDRCCYEMKKNVAHEWSEENNRPITITGMRSDEGGLRQSVQSCTIFFDSDCKELKKFHPLLPIDDKWIEEFIKVYEIELCKLYYPPFNFKRTGCKGCPYSTDLQNQLDIMAEYLPAERKQCELIWKPIYSEYRRIGYRLNTNLFDLEFIV